MRFQNWMLLLVALPWWIVWLQFGRTQRRALVWVEQNIGARFRSRFSIHSRATLAWHLRLLGAMGLLLIVAAAQPYLPGEAEIEAERARVVLIFDGSASMYATDVEQPPQRAEGERERNRFEVARAVGRGVIRELPDATFALVSFSGSAAIHTPMSADRGFLLDAVRGLEIHGQYQTTGSSLGGALDTVFEFYDETRPNLQAVILSDGEQPVEEEFDDTLEALAAQGVPVHTVAIGSTEGQSRLIFDFRDIVAKKEKPAVLREYHTKRVDETLERISRKTNGTFELLSPGTLERIARAIRAYESPPARIEREGTGTDLGVWFLLAFLVAFLADGLLIGRRPRHAPLRFDIERLGNREALPRRTAAVWLLSLVLLHASACSNTPRARAHRENEKGIALDLLRQHEQARVHYKRSIGYGVEPEIPTFNLARSVHKQGDYSEAHELYQDVLKIDPRLPEAHYNDGIALFDWGEAERDPKGCDLERTRELWSRALERFQQAINLTESGQSTGRMARANHENLKAKLAAIARLIADPPPECLGEGGGDSQQQSQGPGGEDQENQDQGGGGGEDQDEEDQGQSGGGGQDQEDQGQGGGGGEDQEDEGQAGGGGEDQEDPGQGGGGDGQDQERRGQGGGGPSPLTQEERDQIAQELQRIGQQRFEAGKYHRRTLPEQFGEEHWRNPDKAIWW